MFFFYFCVDFESEINNNNDICNHKNVNILNVCFYFAVTNMTCFPVLFSFDFRPPLSYGCADTAHYAFLH